MGKQNIAQRILGVGLWTKASILALVCAASASGQIYPPSQPSRGFSPNSSYSRGDIDSINNVTGSVVATVPIVSLPAGRGGSRLSVGLTYNSNIYDVRSIAGAPPAGYSNGVYQVMERSTTGGWQLGFQYGMDYEVKPQSGAVDCQAPVPSNYRVHKMKFRMPDGSVRPLKLQPLSDASGDGFYGVGPNKERICAGSGLSNNDAVPSGDLIYITTDGSFIRVELSYQTLLPGCQIAPGDSKYWECRLWRAFFPDGSEVRGFGKRATTFIDRNANEFYFSQYVNGANTIELIEDSLGRSIEIEKFLDNNGNSTRDEVRTNGANNEMLVWKIYYRDVSVAANMFYVCRDGISIPTGSCNLGTTPTNFRMVDRVEFPSQTGGGAGYDLKFEYDDASARGWGELSEIKFPPREGSPGLGRASIQFEYKWEQYGPSSDSASGQRDITRMPDNPVKRRTLTYADGQGQIRNEHWDYEFTKTFSKTILPDLSERFSYFYDLEQIYDWKKGLVYEETEPQNRKTTRVWSRNPPYSLTDPNAAANAYVSSETVRLGIRGSAKEVTRNYTQDRNGNVVASSESDWIAGNGRSSQRKMLVSTSNASSSAPSDEDGGYWRQLSARRSVRSVTRERRLLGTTTSALAETQYDAKWNPIETRRWDSTKSSAPADAAGNILNSGNSIGETASWTSSGNPSGGADANGNTSLATYGSIGPCSATQSSAGDVYPTIKKQATNVAGLTRTFNYSYDCKTGLVLSQQDADNGTTRSSTYDALGRLRITTAPNGMQAESLYRDGKYRSASYQDLFTVGDRVSRSVQHFDDLGRQFRVQQSAFKDITNSQAQPAIDDADTLKGVVVDSLYMPPCWMGKTEAACSAGSNPERRYRYEAVSAPYRNGSTIARGWTVSKIDELGRVVELRSISGDGLPWPWGSNTNSTGVRSILYEADWTTTTDEAGRKKREARDGYGRVVELSEDPNGRNYITSYEYDGNDNLKRVTQAGQSGNRNRDFEYTSLSRLKQANNPESGIINYTHDNNGNLLTRSDPRVSFTMGGYDALGRPTSKTYSDGTPAVSFAYDSCPFGKGRLCSVATGGSGNEQSTVSFEYDSMSRVVKRMQVVGGASHTVTQNYWPGGLVKEVVYPTSTASNPRKVSYTYWPNGEAKEAWQGDAGSGSRYAYFDDYQANGNAQKLLLGSDVGTEANNVLEASATNERGQLVSRSWTKNGANLLTLGLGYGPINNGNLMSQAISGSHQGTSFSFTQGFDYDDVNRLKLFQDSGVTSCGSGAARQRYAFDRFGNRAMIDGSCGNSNGAFVPWVTEGANATATEANVEAKFPKNRWQVDQNDTQGTGRHDGSGNVTSASGNAFVYDAENRLVRATPPGDFNYRYRYDGEGRRVAVERWTGTSQTQSDLDYTKRFVYGVDGELLAEIQGALPTNWQRRYLGQDHLGSTRLVMDASKSGDLAVESRHDYFPYGEELPDRQRNYGDAALRIKYTGHERDAETGLDFMQARYFGAGFGRFLSPDGPLVDQEVSDGQSWNLYAYVKNNPMALVDPTGMFDEDPNGPPKIKTEPMTVTATFIFLDTFLGESLKRAGKKLADGMERAAEMGAQLLDQYRNQICTGGTAALTMGGARIGAGIGYGIGASTGTAGGLALAAPTGGLAAPATATAGFNAGGAFGALAGGAIGGAAGYGIGTVLCNQGGGGGGGGTGSGGAGDASSIPVKDPDRAKRIKEALDALDSKTSRYARDGITFQNREGKLPGARSGYYTEHTVQPPAGVKNRGVERLVVGAGGEVYYTPDHYLSFVRIR